ncbi:MAG TPA: hypothetical protein PKI46_00955, partial [Bacteroidales bacterium]|nr:hypothetical protein [Bacteroidales bacterium]
MISNNLIDLYKSRLQYKESTCDPNEISINCPNCNDTKQHLGVSFKINAFNCFKCNYHGHINKLTKLLFDIDFKDFVSDNRQLKTEIIYSVNKNPVKLPTDFICLADKFDAYYSKYHDYLFNRRISLMQIKYYNIGISLSKNKGYLYIPIYDINNNQVY